MRARLLGVSSLNVVLLRSSALPPPPPPPAVAHTKVTGLPLHLRSLRSFLRGCSPLISCGAFSYFAIVCVRARARPSREILADAVVFSGSDLRYRVNNTTQSRGQERKNIATNCLGGKKLTRPRLLIRAYVTVDFYRAPRCFLSFLLCSFLPYLRYTIIHSVRKNVKF